MDSELLKKLSKEIHDLKSEVMELRRRPLPMGGGTDENAIHDNVSGEIAAITEKTSLADDDVVLIEDSAATNAKKKSKISTFLAKARSILFLNEITTPSTPASGQVSLYAKDGGLPFVKNDAGIESPIPLGGVWQDWTPAWTNLTVGNGAVYAKYCIIGNKADLRIYVLFGSTTSIGGTIQFSLPTAHAEPYGDGSYRVGTVIFRDAATLSYQGLVEPITLTTFRVVSFAVFGSNIGASGTYPFSMSTNDKLFITASYRIA